MKRFIHLIRKRFRNLNTNQRWYLMLPLCYLVCFAVYPIYRMGLLTRYQGVIAVLLIQLGFALFAIFKAIRMGNRWNR